VRTLTSEDAMQKLQDLCEWQDEYSVGIDVIDRQHQELFRIVEQFRGNLNELSLLDCLTDSSKRIKIYGMILNMRSFFLGHFSTEERYMMRCQCPDFLVHKKEHDLFIKKVCNYSAKKSLTGFCSKIAKFGTASVFFLRGFLSYLAARL
jgi:hemerythrin